ncbi:MAG TPA: SAM-dependent chlorinase/fluorinase [Gemmatimonadales bacterium]|jgi:S-adenosylmethionine hydrolase|nr:SAM-dependent chlorinase/fluorinase [Gemmatimonadales bacterium]
MASLITLLTDFGAADSYVAEVKGVILTALPEATLVDITHQVPPGDVRAGQYLFARTWRRFPAGTVHLVVVDPGVGTPRRALAAEAMGHLFVAPDNGLLSSLPETAEFVSLPVTPSAAPTFHARDVFAPAAARLAMGVSLDDLGDPVTDARRTPLPEPRMDGVALLGEVIYVDRFGTLVSNIPADDVDPGVRIVVEGNDVGALKRTFGDVEPGQLVAYAGSVGEVEVAVRGGSAARLLGVGVGAEVRA